MGSMQGWPGKFGESDDANYMPDLIVVGGVNKDGDYNYLHSYGRPKAPEGAPWQDVIDYDVDVWAPSQELDCPNDKGGMDQFRSGTSHGE
ncbi:hypothetical protein DL95DRAFT_79258 [Leptodontidium sp. 2 PMI_412]|nr:hypothetical protein DL95DRAFT_79258 [Leptodontidium sp. 2 PMI_412]